MLVSSLLFEILPAGVTTGALLSRIQLNLAPHLLEMLVAVSVDATEERHAASLETYLALVHALLVQFLPQPLSPLQPDVSAATRFPEPHGALLNTLTSFVSTRFRRLFVTVVERHAPREPLSGGTSPLVSSIPAPLISLLSIAALLQQYAPARGGASSLAASAPLDIAAVLPSDTVFMRKLWRCLSASTDLVTALRTPAADGLLSDGNNNNNRITPLFACSLLFCVCYLRVLSTLDDQHFADAGEPFPLHTVKEIAYTCKQLVWQHIWTRAVDKPEVSYFLWFEFATIARTHARIQLQRSQCSNERRYDC